MSGEIRPVAVTGIGIRSPLGATAMEHWAGIVSGRRSVQPLAPAQIPAAGIRTPGWTEWCGAPAAGVPAWLSPVELTTLAGHVAAEAREQSGLLYPPSDLGSKIGVVFGASKPVLSDAYALPPEAWISLRADAVDETMFPLADVATEIASVFNLGGPLLTPCAACATGLVSIIRGAELIRDGACDIVIAGSADSSLHPAYLAAYRRMGVLAPAGDDPAASCRPFDAHRSGFAVGEGAAAIVLEDMDHARRRGATILAEVLGAGLTSDNDSLIDVDPAGKSLARAIRDALVRSGVRPEEIDAASLHGTATRLNDLCETNALKRALGEHARRVSCFSLKGAIGHLMGAAGSVETATLIQAMQQQVVPPTMNLETPDPECDLDYTPGQARPRQIQTALKLSLGFGGTCAALVLRRPTSIS